MINSIEELVAEVEHLKALLTEANEMQRHLAVRHLKACEKTDSIAQIVAAILLKENGQVFIPKECLGGVTATLGFRLQTLQDGCLLSLNSKDNLQ